MRTSGHLGGKLKVRRKSEIKIEPIYDIEMEVADALVQVVRVLPSWSMRLKALETASEILKGQYLWDKRQQKRGSTD